MEALAKLHMTVARAYKVSTHREIHFFNVQWILKYSGKFWNSQILSITQPAAPYESMAQLFEYGPAFWVYPKRLRLPQTGWAVLKKLCHTRVWHSFLSTAQPVWGRRSLFGYTQKAGPYSKSCAILSYGAAGWVILKIWEFQNFPEYFRIHWTLKKCISLWVLTLYARATVMWSLARASI